MNIIDIYSRQHEKKYGYFIYFKVFCFYNGSAFSLLFTIKFF